MRAEALRDELYFGAGTRENKPRFLNHPEILEKYWKRLEPGLKAYLKRNLGYIPSFKDVEVRIARLPTFYLPNEDRVRPVGKIAGAYLPGEQRLYLDPSIFDELDDPERALLEEYGLRGNATDTFVHELLHSVQDRLGSLYRQPAWLTEGVATRLTGEITGRRQMAYWREQEKVDGMSRYLDPEALLKGASRLNLN